MTPVEALQCVVEAFGGQSALAKAISKRTGRNIKQQHVWNWLNRDGGLPPAYAPLIESLCRERNLHITCSHLCPAFYL